MTDALQTPSYPKTEEFLEHFGVKGMRWGFRKQKDGTVKKEGPTKSSDHVRARELQKKKASELTNEELKVLNERLNLEQNYARMTAQPSKIKKGMAVIEATQKVAKTGIEFYNMANSPAAKAARGVIEAQLKK